MSKSNIESKLEQRETRRKQSVVIALIGNEREELKSIEPQRGRPSDPTKEKKERKSLALLPSVYENVAKIAYVDRTSVSEIVSTLLEKYIEENQLKLLEHDRIKK